MCYHANAVLDDLSIIQAPGQGRGLSKRSVNRGAAAIEVGGDFVRVLALAAEFLRVFDLVRGEFVFWSGPYASLSRGLHSFAGPFHDHASFEFS